MPRFFIDTHDGATLTRDDEGETFETVDEARKAAIVTLPGFADGSMADGENRAYQAILRDEEGHNLYIATLAFHGEWQTKRG